MKNSVNLPANFNENYIVNKTKNKMKKIEIFTNITDIMR